MSDLALPFPVLAIDHGLKFIGLAISRTGYFADPMMVIQRKSKAEDFAKINAIIAEEHIAAIVLGLPPTPPDFEGFSQADKVRNWAGYLYEAIADDLPIYFWDEGLTSYDAEQLLDDMGKRIPERVDAHAAAVILQSLLDALREGESLPDRFIAEISVDDE